MLTQGFKLNLEFRKGYQISQSIAKLFGVFWPAINNINSQGLVSFRFHMIDLKSGDCGGFSSKRLTSIYESYGCVFLDGSYLLYNEQRPQSAIQIPLTDYSNLVFKNLKEQGHAVHLSTHQSVYITPSSMCIYMHHHHHHHHHHHLSNQWFISQF